MVHTSSEFSNLSILWIKVLVSSSLGVAFTIYGIIAMWLLVQKIGHRTLLMLKLVFTWTFAFSQFEIALNIYFRGVNFAVLMRGIAAVLGVALAAYAWQQKSNLCATLEGSEAANQKRKAVAKDAASDQTMAHVFTVRAMDMCIQDARTMRGRQDEIIQRG